jgi:hypothetical protein
MFSHASNSFAEVTVYEGITALVYVFQCLRYTNIQMLTNLRQTSYTDIAVYQAMAIWAQPRQTAIGLTQRLIIHHIPRWAFGESATQAIHLEQPALSLSGLPPIL